MSDPGSRRSVIVRNPNFGRQELDSNSPPTQLVVRPTQNVRLGIILRNSVTFTSAPIIIKSESAPSSGGPVSKPVETPGASFELHTQTPKKR